MRKKVIVSWRNCISYGVKGFISILFMGVGFTSVAQTLPVGTPVLEETWRRMQIKGERDINVSFAVRPVYANGESGYDSLFNPDNSLSATKRYLKDKARVLPITVTQQYNTHHPYGWNDGAMIPARGYQARLSAGIYSKIGPLSVQLQPELVYAQNKNFSTFPSSHTDTTWNSYYTLLNRIDNPEKYGDGNYAKLFPGQSSIRFNYKKLSIGVSTENLAWGPGIRNSLLMSNNAPGFAHISFNTTAPVISPIGSFEWQVISGRLKGSGILPPDTGRTFNGAQLYQPKQEDGDRYLNGMIITWQPKWTKGLHLGFSRVFYVYESDRRSTIDGYLPIIGSFFKGNADGVDTKNRDQMLSVFLRFVLPKEQAEFYAEYGRNDHSQNFRDLLLEPEHARAYIIGGRKIFSTKKNTDLELMMEITNLQAPATGLLREIPAWYVHHQVRHGYTNRGQVLGAGIGPGSNSQTIGLSWMKGIKEFGVLIERIARNNDFYYDAFGRAGNFGGHWVDMALHLNKSWQCKRFIYAANLSLVRSFNYQWRFEDDVANLQGSCSIMYLF